MKRNSESARLVDFFGRSISYLRVSLTEKCNMRCGYCYSSAACNSSGRGELGNDQLVTLFKAFASLGINKVRFTGGEPLLRRGLIELVAETKRIAGISIVAITTNGLLLKKNLNQLIDAGLNRINISLDTLKRDKFKQITGVDGLGRVISVIEAVVSSGAFDRVKVNTVVMRGVNDDELSSLARWALDLGIEIRFIEFMPTEKSGWSIEKFIGEAEMRDRIGLALIPLSENSVSPGPEGSYGCEGFTGRVSFISAVSRSFCNACNRLRLTSHGELVGCLFRDDKRELRGLLRDGASVGEIAQYISAMVVGQDFRREPGKVSISNFKPFMKAVGG